jgi:hypothetical protein
MRNYLDLHRHAAVRLALLANPNAALRLLIAHAISASGNWSVKPDRQRTEGEAIAASLAASPAQIAFEKEREKVRKLGGLDGADGDEVAVCCGTTGDDEATTQIFARLARLSEANLARVAAFVMAETLAVGSAAVDTVGVGAGLKPRDRVFLLPLLTRRCFLLGCQDGQVGVGQMHAFVNGAQVMPCEFARTTCHLADEDDKLTLQMIDVGIIELRFNSRVL